MMRQSDVFSVLLRRWYLVLVVLVATLAGASLAGRVVPPTYRAEASVLLLPPKVLAEDASSNGGNPLLSLGGLGPTASVLARAMTDAQTERTLKAHGAVGDYTVEPDLTTSGPVLLVRAEDAQPVVAVATLQLVLDQLPRTLTALQESIGAPQKSRLSVSVINREREPVEVRKRQLRAVIVAVLVTAGMGALGILLFDGLVIRRRRRREEVVEELALIDQHTFPPKSSPGQRALAAKLAAETARDG